MNRATKELRHFEGLQPDKGAPTAAPMIVPAPSGNTLEKLIAARVEFDTLFIDPRHQITMLDEYYVDGPGTLDRCMPIHLVMAPASVAIVATQIRRLAVVENELLPRCGFSQIKRIVARRQVSAADLWNAHVIVVAERGGAALAVFDDHEWVELAASVGPLEFAELVHPGEKRRLHAFAPSYRPGWTTLTPNKTWIEEPTL